MHPTRSALGPLVGLFIQNLLGCCGKTNSEEFGIKEEKWTVSQNSNPKSGRSLKLTAKNEEV
ncbi:MAG: hypothetical protein NTX00_01335 [Candidatus Parcubacteria bacterium]|nr:hypothetical protein [Candidatus Parcubacteria bacterium]